MAEYRVVGKPTPRIDGVELATGRVTFGVDVKLPGMLYGKVLRSSYPYARILSIDTSKAEKIPGVKAVITGEDYPKGRVGLSLKDHTMLAQDGVVRYIGDEIAAVAAVDEDTAEKAIEAIEVDFEELPAVFSPEEALRSNAPLVHEGLGSYPLSSFFPRFYRPAPGTNIANYYKLRKGDVEKGFQESDFVFEDTFTTSMVQHCPIEPNACVASVSPSGKITVWTNAQRIYDIRLYLADTFGIPMSNIRVILTKVGGGFGVKVVPRLEPICVALAKKANQPVKIVMSRTEEFSATVGHPATIVKIKTGVSKDSKIIAREIDILWNAGAYSELGIVISVLGALSSPGPYKIPNVKVDSRLVYTNQMPSSAFRGMGVTQVTWAVESQMDIIARKLGIDPVEFRTKNLVENGSTSPWGEVLDDVGLKECLIRVTENLGWGQKLGPNQGQGISVNHKFTAGGSSSGAIIKVNEDGTIELIVGASEIGQGSNTVLAQVAAEELGVSLDSINVATADTDVSPYDMGSFSSRVTFHTGNAVRIAAAEVKRRALEIAAQRMATKVEALGIGGGRVFIKEAPEKSISLGDLSRTSPILGSGLYRGRGSMGMIDPETGQSERPVAYWDYAATGAQVEVDIETGMVKVQKLVCAVDPGFVINPLTAEGQIEGSLVMGCDGALQEVLLFDQGRIINPSFRDYRISTAVEAAQVIPLMVELPWSQGPFGAKGIGEVAVCGVAPAIANAIYSAIEARLKELPMTPEKVLQALEESRKSA